MSELKRMAKLAAAVFAAAMVMLTVATPSDAASGTVRLHITKAGFIVGVGGGSGTLHFRGKSYRLRVGGVGVGSLGIATVNLSGTASNLQRASDIVGTYGAAGASASIVGGGQVATLQNERGVVLRLSGPQIGFQVSLGLAGMTVSMR